MNTPTAEAIITMQGRQYIYDKVADSYFRYYPDASRAEQAGGDGFVRVPTKLPFFCLDSCKPDIGHGEYWSDYYQKWWENILDKVASTLPDGFPKPKPEDGEAQQWKCACGDMNAMDEGCRICNQTAQPPQRPEGGGCVLVPKVATKEMLAAAMSVKPVGQFYPGHTADESEFVNEKYFGSERRAAVYSAMLSAAPAPPAVGDPLCGCGKPAEYYDSNGKPSCNKHLRCANTAPPSLEVGGDELARYETHVRMERDAHAIDISMDSLNAACLAYAECVYKHDEAAPFADESGMRDAITAFLLAQPHREGVAVAGWIHEDELPNGYPYDAMFPHSKVDGVRVFPVFMPSARQPASAAVGYWQRIAETYRTALFAKQARIDELMLEYCPGEMTRAQRDEWMGHQRPVFDPANQRADKAGGDNGR